MTKLAAARAALGLAALLLAPLALAHPTSAQAGSEGTEGAEEVVRLTAWPELDKDLERQVETDVARIRKARTDEMASQGHDGIVAAGAGAAPALLEALGKEKDDEARARLIDALDAITGAPHTRLLAESFAAKSPVVRAWALRRVAGFPDAGTREAAAAAYAAATKPKKPDVEEVYVAALALTASGSTDGLDALYHRAIEGWGEEGEAIRTASESVRSSDAAARFVDELPKGRAQTLAALRMLGGCGTEEEVPAVAPFLDSDDTGIRIGAINALRGMLEGEKPVARMSAFDAIELAQEWKNKLR